jgi:hypothetical protein
MLSSFGKLRNFSNNADRSSRPKQHGNVAKFETAIAGRLPACVSLAGRFASNCTSRKHWSQRAFSREESFQSLELICDTLAKFFQSLRDLHPLLTRQLPLSYANLQIAAFRQQTINKQDK